MKIKSQQDFFAGLMFLVVGGGFAWGATTYNVGTGARMGPGYFPLMLGILLAILGAIIMLKALVVETVDGAPIGKWAWKQIFFIIAANLLFGVLLAGLPSLGVPAMGRSSPSMAWPLWPAWRVPISTSRGSSSWPPFLPRAATRRSSGG